MSQASSSVHPNPDPLAETAKYVKVADLSSGSFGFVQLARNAETNELVAIKFIERGDRVNRYVEVRAPGCGGCCVCEWFGGQGGAAHWCSCSQAPVGAPAQTLMLPSRWRLAAARAG